MIDNYDWEEDGDNGMLEQVESLDRQIARTDTLVREEQINRVRVR